MASRQGKLAIIFIPIYKYFLCLSKVVVEEVEEIPVKAGAAKGGSASPTKHTAEKSFDASRAHTKATANEESRLAGKSAADKS